MDTEKTQPVKEKERTLIIDEVVMALRENGITPVRVDTDGPVNISFKYDDSTFNLNLDNTPFLSFTLEFELKTEDDISLMKVAAEYVSLRCSGACVFVVPDDLFWVVKYDYLSDSISSFRNQLSYVLDNMSNIAGYFYHYYHNLVTNKRDTESTVFVKTMGTSGY